jgi:hypothetical protein
MIHQEKVSRSRLLLRRPLTGLVPAIRLLLRPRHPVFFSGISGVSEASIGLKILFTISQSYFRL